MILLAGGTSETAPLARALLGAGHSVLASMATDAPLDLPLHERFELRRGRLDGAGFAELLSARGVRAVVDASHPFATALRAELSAACRVAGVPRVRFERSAAVVPPEGTAMVDDHEAAAVEAFRDGAPVLLTTGSRHLAPYVREAGRRGVPLYARVLPEEESLRACAVAGIASERVEAARGPFAVDDTRALLRRWGIGTLVAKDGGGASGLAERLAASRAEGVRVVLVRRPDMETGSVTSEELLLAALERMGVLP